MKDDIKTQIITDGITVTDDINKSEAILSGTYRKSGNNIIINIIVSDKKGTSIYGKTIAISRDAIEDPNWLLGTPLEEEKIGIIETSKKLPEGTITITSDPLDADVFIDVKLI